MRYDKGVQFVKQVSGNYNPQTSTVDNVVNKAVGDMANITEATATTQKAVLGEIRPRVLMIRTRERPGIRFDYVLIDGSKEKWKQIHEVRTLKGFALMVGEQDDRNTR